MSATLATLFNQFKVAKWETPAEAEAFVLQVQAAPEGQLVLKILELLTAKDAGKDPVLHRRRCGVFVTVTDFLRNPAFFVPMVKALKVADLTLRAALVSLIPKVNNIADHAELCALLNNADASLRTAVSALLMSIGGKTVNQQLTSLMKDKGFLGRMEAIDILVKTSGHHALPVLQEVLAGNKQPEKLLALKYLGDPKFFAKETTKALQAIATLLVDPVEEVAVQAVGAFGRMCTEEDWFDVLATLMDSDRVSLVKAAIESLKRFPSPRSILMVERKLRAGPNVIRFAGLGVLEAIATNDILGPLVDALSHKQVVVRNRAGEILTRLGKAGKLELSRTIIFLLKSQDVNVRRMALELARTVTDPNSELWPKLLNVLRDEDWWVRERVVDVLVEMAGQKLTQHIVPYLTDPSDVVRRYAADVLIRLKDPTALGALVRMAQEDTDWWAREKALEAVAAINDPRAIPYVLNWIQSQPDLRWACLRALMDMDAKQTASQVAALLQDPSSDVRSMALACLKKFSDPAQAPAVQALLLDPENSIRVAARDLLAYWSIIVAAEAGLPKDAVSPLDRLLIGMAKQGADDLILACERKPMMKKMGKTFPLLKNPLTSEQVRSILLPKLTAAQLAELECLRDVDFSYEVKAEGLRFRANIFQESNGLAAVFRIIKGELPDAEKLGLPATVIKLGDMKNGLVLIGGPTGSGKSTTLAALVNDMNKRHGRHIICLEDPIEVVHPSLKSLVNQREIGTHTQSFHRALRATLREDPNVILVGELRDLPTISFAVTAAETGHLVFGTVHTVSADTTVDRMINTFPGRQQDQVRSMLSESLRGVVCQYLLRQTDGVSRCLAMEIMLNNDAISALIRKGKAFQIPSVISTNRDAGMQSMDGDLMRLYKEGKVSIEDVYVKARSKKEFEPYMPQVTQGLQVSSVERPAATAAPNATPAPATPPSVLNPPQAASAQKKAVR